jgi:ubiquinone/menaquinone biosynthesis C-methylase UbiE
VTTPHVASGHVRHNQAFWDADSDNYQAVHGDALAQAPLAWGAYRVPEANLQVLGAVAGREMLELGCGAAQWSIALAEQGARVVALDVSQGQLAHARSASARLPIVQASGEQLPFADASFDVVFCDHGALSFCDPEVSVPECARILRPGGLLAFCCTHPLLYLTWDDEKEQQTRKLQIAYSELGRMPLAEGTIDWVLPASGWIRVLRANGFEIEDLVELLAGDAASTTYDDFAPPKWARRWPAEWIWKARLGRAATEPT